MLIIVAFLGMAACSQIKDALSAPSGGTGGIRGRVSIFGETVGIDGALVRLEARSGDSLSSQRTDSTGKYEFGTLKPGGYRVRLALPPGTSASQLSDTLQEAQVSRGTDTDANFTPRAIVSVIDTLSSAKPDTVTLRGGAQVVLRLVGSNAPFPYAVTAVAGDLLAGRALVGTALRITPIGGASTRARETQRSVSASDALGDVSLSFRLPTPAKGAPGATYAVLGALSADGVPSTNGSILLSQLQAADPLANGRAAMLAGNTGLSRQDFAALTLGIVAPPSTCAGQFGMTEPAGFTGQELLVLVHGIQVQYDSCDEYNDYDPERDTFRDLLVEMRANSAMKSRFHVYVFKYPTYDGVASAAAELSARMRRVSNGTPKRWTVLAHSMGGLVARRMLAIGDNSSIVSHVVTLATPHRGSPVASSGVFATSLPVVSCYDQFYNAFLTALPNALFALNIAEVVYFQDATKQGVQDLFPTRPELVADDAHAALFTTFAGARKPPLVGHTTSWKFWKGWVTNGFLTHASCVLSALNIRDNDGLVPLASGNPSWSPQVFGPYPRDHVQMAGADASDVADDYLATLFRVLLPSEIRIESNIATSWTLDPDNAEGSGISGSAQVTPKASGSTYTLRVASIAGREVIITSAQGTSSTVRLQPGETARFSIRYGGVTLAPPSSVTARTAGSAAVSLSWVSNVVDADEFTIERAESASGPWSVAATVGAGVRAYDQVGLPQRTANYFRVTTSRGSLRSAPSSVVSAMTLSSYPYGPQAGMSTVVIGGAIFTFGHFNNGGYPASPVVNSYSPASDTWTTLGGIPNAYGNMSGAAIVGGRVYVTGGSYYGSGPFSSALNIYEPASNAWSVGPDHPVPTAGGVSGAIGGKLYVYTANPYLNAPSFVVFDVVSHVWSTLPLPSSSHTAGSGGVLAGRFYLVGGSESGVRSGRVEIFDPVSMTWSDGPSLSIPRSGLAMAFGSSSMYAIGGYAGGPSCGLTAEVERYDVGSGSWIRLIPMRSPKAAVGAAISGSTLYLIGGTIGCSATFNDQTPELELYDLSRAPP